MSSTYTLAEIVDLLNYITYKNQVTDFKKIQRYVLVTILVLVLQLGFLMKPFAYRFFRLLSWASYLLVPVLISYILGLMGKSAYEAQNSLSSSLYVIGNPFLYISCVWAIFLLFAYAGFDNLNAFSLEERNGRSKIVLQVGIQFTLLILILCALPEDVNIIPIACVFLILSFKFAGRILALAHSAGATPRIKTDVSRIIDYMNVESGSGDPDPNTMVGYNYLVGPKYSIPEAADKRRFADGVTLEKIWGCQWRLLSTNMQLKDTCLSFSLFWLLLGKFLGFPLYEGGGGGGRTKAWKLVRDGLLADKHERVFRVIEVELAFLRDYFHSKYIFFYLNGFYWKLINVLALPVMFWWFIQHSTDRLELIANTYIYGGFAFTRTANIIIISVVLALEVLQVLVFLNSRWLKVTLVCYYVNRMTTATANPPGCLSRWFLDFVGSVFLRSSSSSAWRKPWKRELDQFSLVQSCTNFPKATRFLHLHFVSILGIPLPKPSIKKGSAINLSDQIKKAIVLSLKTNSSNNKPKLSNGVASLRRYGVMKDLSWAYKLDREIDVIIIWHIATSFCEIHPSSKSTSSIKDVATSLSKYSAYLLFFASSLLPFSSLEGENICSTVAEEAIELFKNPAFSCGKITNSDNYEKMKGLINDDVETGSDPKSNNIMRKGARLGNQLVSLVSDEEKRWKILAEFWAEMLLFLAPSNNNETAHANRLSEGGEFITHLWALLNHAGITNRDDMVTSFQEDDDDESHQPRVESA